MQQGTRLAATALGTLRLACHSGVPPSLNVAYALRGVHTAYVRVVEDLPDAAAAELTSTVSSLALASQQVSAMTTMVGDAFFAAAHWLSHNPGMLQGRPATVWLKRILAAATFLGEAKLAIKEAAVLCSAASAAVSVADSTTHFPGHDEGDSKRRQWSNAAREYLGDAHDNLVSAQGTLAEARIATATAIGPIKQLVGMSN